MKVPSPFVSRLLWCSFALATGVTGWWIGKNGREESPAPAGPRITSPGVHRTPVVEKNGSASATPPVEENSVAAAMLRKASPGVINAALVQEMNAVLDEPDVDARTAKWNALLAAMRKEDAVAVRGIFLDNDKRGRWFIPEWIVFWKKFGELDGPAALDEWNATGNHADQDSPGRIVASAIKARGMVEAQKLMARDDVKNSRGLMKEVVKAVAGQALDKGANFSLATVPEDFRDVAAQAIVEAGIDRGGLEQAPQLMQSLVAAGAGEQALQSAFSTLISTAWRGGADRVQEFALQQVDQPWCTPQSLMSVTARLAQTKPDSALDSIAKLPAAKATMNIDMAVQLSAHSNPDAIGLWLKGHPSTPYYDQVTAAYCRSISALDASAAEAWAKTIKDPAVRETARPAR